MADSPPNPRILFLAPTFLWRRTGKALRGVQLFDLQLARELADLSVGLTIVADSSWSRRLNEQLGDRDIRVIYTPPFKYAIVNSVIGGLLARRSSYDAMILGNPARALTPAVRMLLKRRCVERITLIAHRSVRESFAAVSGAWPMRIVAVNSEIERQARALYSDVEIETYYGIPDPGRFHPATRERPDGPTRFCVIGKLDNAWKGADDAVAAFESLPDTIRSSCELHLASYERPPRLDRAGIVVHRWLASDQIPDLLRSMDVMLVPSTSHETFSQAIVQGMLTGLPVIVRDLPILTEKLDAGGGLVFSTVEQLRDAMVRLHQESSLRRELGCHGRATALERYTWSTRTFLERFVFDQAPPAPRTPIEAARADQIG